MNCSHFNPTAKSVSLHPLSNGTGQSLKADEIVTLYNYKHKPCRFHLNLHDSEIDKIYLAFIDLDEVLIVERSNGDRWFLDSALNLVKWARVEQKRDAVICIKSVDENVDYVDKFVSLTEEQHASPYDVVKSLGYDEQDESDSLISDMVLLCKQFIDLMTDEYNR